MCIKKALEFIFMYLSIVQASLSDYLVSKTVSVGITWTCNIITTTLKKRDQM